MTYTVLVSARASEELEASARWWAEHRSAFQAQRWYDGFILAIRSLQTDPEQYPLANESDQFPYAIRQLVYGLGRSRTHRAVFTIREDSVVVLSIRHLAQQDIDSEDLDSGI